MDVIHQLDALRKRLANAGTIAFVPTMGNLHEGHLSLIRLARQHGQTVVASIFVNPLQFGPKEDFASYPRTLERDCEMLKQSGCNVVFAPSTKKMYPQPQTYMVKPDPALANILEGAFRPGFFDGVCTVVMKLFLCVQPDVAVFGKKDYQQLLVVRAMVQQMLMPIQIIAGETGRADSGLALSSRNGYLDKDQLQQAAQLNAALKKVRDLCLQKAELPAAKLAKVEQEAIADLSSQGWQVDYLTVRNALNLGDPDPQQAMVVLAAAKLGTTRLIDNLEFFPT
jgi:pantoate--beta-alanine ligase